MGRSSSAGAQLRQGPRNTSNKSLQACASLVMSPSISPMSSQTSNASSSAWPSSATAGPQPSTFDPAPLQHVRKVQDWSVEDVCEFLRQSGLGMYEESFRNDCVDGGILVC